MCRFRPNVYGVNEILKRNRMALARITTSTQLVFPKPVRQLTRTKQWWQWEQVCQVWDVSLHSDTVCVCVSLFSLQHLAHLQEIAWWEILHQTAGSQGLVNPGVIADLWTLVPPQAWRACHSYTHTNYYATHPYITRLNVMCKVTMCLRIMTYVSFPCVM